MTTAYNDLINIPSFGKKKETEFNPERGDVCFYCRDCRKVAEVTRLHPQKYDYECNECKGKNIAIGTLSSIQEVYLNKR
jgi:Zn finger protein HypA/HybF involved in hydrogenase expression